MKPLEIAREITLEVLDGRTHQTGWSVADEVEVIELHVQKALTEQREAIARMVADWGRHGQGGYCMAVYPQIAQAIREGKTCIHDWIDIRNQVIASGEMCRICGALGGGHEAPGTP